MKNVNRTLATALCLLWLCSAAGADMHSESAEIIEPDARFTALRAEIAARVAAGELPSVSLAAIEKGEIIWLESFGYADRAERRVATPHTQYLLASISKSFTGMAVLKLVQEGRVDLDRAVNDYIQPFVLLGPDGRPSGATVRQVLNMTAGLPHGGVVINGRLEERMTVQEWFRRYGRTMAKPGTIYHYSNFSSGVAELLVEQVSGLSLESFTRSRLFLPLGMFTTSIDPLEGAVLATPYSGSGAAQTPDFDQVPFASASFHSTVWDLARYALFNLGHGPQGEAAPLDREHRELMHYSVDGNHPEALMALGWFYTPRPDGVRGLVTDGSAGGASSNITVFPDLDIGAVALVNKTSWDSVSGEITGSILEILHPGLSEGGAEMRKEYYRRFISNEYAPAAPLTGTWQGTVQTADSTGEITMKFRKNGEVLMRLGGDPLVLIMEARLNGRHFSGSSMAHLPVEGLTQQSPNVTVELWLNDGVLQGYLLAHYRSLKTPNTRFDFLPAIVQLAPGEERE